MIFLNGYHISHSHSRASFDTTYSGTAVSPVLQSLAGLPAISASAMSTESMRFHSHCQLVRAKELARW